MPFDIYDKYNYSCSFCPVMMKLEDGFLVPEGLHMYHRIMFLIFIFVFLINTLSIYIFLSCQDLLTVNGILMLLLSIVDIFSSFTLCFSSFIADVTHKLPWTVCVIQAGLFPFFSGLSLMILLLLNIDRYIVILKPLRYEKIVTKTRLFIVLILVSLFHLGFTIKFLLSSDIIIISSDAFICTVSFSKDPIFWMILTFVDYVMTSSIMVIVYSHILIIFKRLNKIGCAQMNTESMKKNKKGLRTIFLIVVTYYISWSLTAVDVSLSTQGISDHFYHLHIFALYFITLNGIWNTIIYGSTNVNFKRVVKKKFNQIVKKLSNRQ